MPTQMPFSSSILRLNPNGISLFDKRVPVSRRQSFPGISKSQIIVNDDNRSTARGPTREDLRLEEASISRNKTGIP